MKKNKFLYIFPVFALILSGCSFANIKNWFSSNVCDPVKGCVDGLINPDNQKENHNNDDHHEEEHKPDEEEKHTHNYGTLINEVSPTCLEDGMKAHYVCEECGKYFDENKNEVSQSSLIIEKLGHLPGEIWYEDEGYHYHICERCAHRVDVGTHNLVQIEGAPADHEHDGTFMHYECEICDKKFLDSHGLVQIVHFETSMTGHDKELTFHPEVLPTCENEGRKEYYSCSCGKLFKDKDGLVEIEQPEIIPALGHIHNDVWHFDGSKHWHVCYRCNKVLDEHEHTSSFESFHNLTHSWNICTECGQKTNIQELEISGCHHERLMHFDKVYPTFTKPGHIEYYYCLDCLKCFFDANCEQEIENTEYGVLDKRDGRYLSPITTSFSILNQNLKNYLDAESDAEVIAALKDNSVYNYQAGKMVMWEDTLKTPYVIELSSTRMFETYKSYSSNMNAYTFDGLFTPGETYYYRVKDATNSYIVDDLSFRIDDSYSLRTLTVDGVSNFRDLGGWIAKDGIRIPYGNLYRGGELKVIKEKGKEQFLGDLGIKTEIDIRGDNPQQILFDSRLNYLNLPIWMYTSIIPGISISLPDGPTFAFHEYSIASIKSIFEVLADRNNYPVYYHCSAGADRTGTLSYLINGLLGVSFEDLTRDFELTSFSVFGERYRSTPTEDLSSFDNSGYYKNKDGNWMCWGKMNDMITTFYGEDDKPLYVAIENYLKQACGVSSETIASVRNNLLGQEVNF